MMKTAFVKIEYMYEQIFLAAKENFFVLMRNAMITIS